MNFNINQTSECCTLETSSKSSAALMQGFLPLDPTTWGADRVMPFDAAMYQPEQTTAGEDLPAYLFIGTKYGSVNFKPNHEKAKTLGTYFGIALALLLPVVIIYEIYNARRTELSFPLPNLTIVAEQDEGGFDKELDSTVVSGGCTENMSNFYVHNSDYVPPSYGKRGALRVDNRKGFGKLFFHELTKIMTETFPFKRKLLYATNKSYLYSDFNGFYGVRITDDGLEAKFFGTGTALDPQVKLDDADSVFESILRKSQLDELEPFMGGHFFHKDNNGDLMITTQPVSI